MVAGFDHPGKWNCDRTVLVRRVSERAQLWRWRQQISEPGGDLCDRFLRGPGDRARRFRVDANRHRPRRRKCLQAAGSALAYTVWSAGVWGGRSDIRGSSRAEGSPPVPDGSRDFHAASGGQRCDDRPRFCCEAELLAHFDAHGGFVCLFASALRHRAGKDTPRTRPARDCDRVRGKLRAGRPSHTLRVCSPHVRGSSGGRLYF